MNRSVDKQGTDLLDIMRITVDEVDSAGGAVPDRLR